MVDSKLTVLMPTYNCAHFLEESINSILQQTFTDFEFIIVDDGSTDNTKEVVSQFLSDGRIKYVYKENSGTGNTLNRGLQLATTAYVVLMDADDISHPDRLEKLYHYMEQNPKVVACGSSISYFINNLDEERTYTCRLPINNSAIVQGLLNMAHTFCHASFIFRTATAKKIGGFDLPGIGEDLDFTLKLSKEGELSNMDETLYHVRMNPNSVTSTKYIECILNYKFTINMYRNKMNLSELDTFLDQQSRSLLSKTLLQLDNQSLKLYRKGVKHYIYNNNVKYYFFAVLASLVSPNRLWKRILRNFQIATQP